ncbi:MAG TPA: non-canonical purine NTP pyrophosphatase [Candidatus Treponema faecavium]|nr:non-canonical purine NTP pyrophosphatase [Candidatus Treponema faecavium]
MNTKLYFASGNAHKRQEMAKLLPGYTIVIPADEGISFEPEETGSSFAQNSLIKAQALWQLVRAPVIADDSGICVDALGGAPGIYSARYAGREHRQGLADGTKLSQQEQNRLLLLDIEQELRLSASNEQPRSCRYVCAMTLCLAQDRFYIVQETMEGELIPHIEQARGSGGFGYDPLVLLPAYNKTVAELSAQEKNAMSHRGKAARVILALLDSLQKPTA